VAVVVLRPLKRRRRRDYLTALDVDSTVMPSRKRLVPKHGGRARMRWTMKRVVDWLHHLLLRDELRNDDETSYAHHPLLHHHFYIWIRGPLGG